eukprot:TRINITY_DN14209_c0_g1_i1.p1 TRINITY_DN14209_c0_g1~~TRINITY_DN14209_c0_g1_i1.p1  ORF type:complete len:405 (-),score=60.54 TRINITY_DN14209_c0_g1_i1:123-1337(-)
MYSLSDQFLLEDVKIDESNAVTREMLHKELVARGYGVKMVSALLGKFQINDVQSAITAMTKTKRGWIHTFTEGSGKKCLICGEKSKAHMIVNKNDDPDKKEDAKMEWRPPIQCKVCLENVPLGSEYFLACGHVHCRKCMRMFLDVKIGDKAILDLKCPEEKCRQRFNKKEIKALCTLPVYKKYLDFKLDHDISLNDKIRWCPNAKCGRYVVNTRGRSRVRCDCGMELCFKCGEKWHEGNCAKHSDKLYKAWAVGKPVQLCPKCKVRIEKDEGCPHMTCTNCDYEWCWICGLSYSRGPFENAFFSCMLLECVAGSLTLRKLVLANFVAFLLTPLTSLLCAAGFIGGCMADCFDSPYEVLYEAIKYFFLIVILIVLAVILGVVMMLPVLLFRLYCAFYSIVRICKL